MASRALTPSQGAAAACAALPCMATLEARGCDVGRPTHIRNARMDHHGHVCVVERAPFQQLDLAAAAQLLGRRTQHGQAGTRRPRPTGRSASPAPTPAVPMMLWPHPWPMPGSASYSQQTTTCGPGPSPARAGERGLDAVRLPLHGEAAPLELVGQLIRGEVLLEAELGPLVDGMRQLDQALAACLDRRARPRLSHPRRNLSFVGAEPAPRR